MPWAGTGGTRKRLGRKTSRVEGHPPPLMPDRCVSLQISCPLWAMVFPGSSHGDVISYLLLREVLWLRIWVLTCWEVPGAEHSAVSQRFLSPLCTEVHAGAEAMTEWPVASSRWGARGRLDPTAGRVHLSPARCCVEAWKGVHATETRRRYPSRTLFSGFVVVVAQV